MMPLLHFLCFFTSETDAKIILYFCSHTLIDKEFVQHVRCTQLSLKEKQEVALRIGADAADR